MVALREGLVVFVGLEVDVEEEGSDGVRGWRREAQRWH
jgi:hypothetical protein